jgi:hypothetical protein
MRLNEYVSRQYVVISRRKDVKDEPHSLAFYDIKENYDEFRDEIEDEEVVIFEGYVDIPDVEIYEHPDFEAFIKEDVQ